MSHAPAKLNLFLEVCERRDDGFHEIETLMIPVSLWDTLVLRSAPADASAGSTSPPIGFTLRSQASWSAGAGRPQREVPGDATNLVVRAVELLRERAGIAEGAEITLVKRIPAAAGLGGGSSDAAAALLAANAAWRLNWSPAQLAPLAAELGSDVPFFLYRSAAICRGRGELVEPCHDLGDWHAVIVVPPVGLATADVYHRVVVSQSPRRVGEFVQQCRRGSRPAPYNALESPARELTPWIDRVRGELARTGCRRYAMSGSGSSYFGLFLQARRARRAATQLRARDVGEVFVVRCAA